MTDPVIIGDATLINADVITGLQSLADDSVDCVVTSPPYWGLRDYGVEGMIGLEPTFAEYLTKMVAVFEEVKRVLKPTGTCWVNMGDAYAQGGGKRRADEDIGYYKAKEQEYIATGRAANMPASWDERGDRAANTAQGSFKPKDLLLMPARVAIALQDAGWWVRSEIIWAKPNPMPESVTDRPTSAHEKIYLLTKRGTYFYDADAVREPVQEPWRSGNHEGGRDRPDDDLMTGRPRAFGWQERAYNPSGRNLRNVWTIATQPYPEAHFATFPEELPRKCIMAGTSERGVCYACGKPWERVVEKTGGPPKGRHSNKPDYHRTQYQDAHPEGNSTGGGLSHQYAKYGYPETKTLGWQPTCPCVDTPTIPATVLDPFSGSGTTGLVALKLDRLYIGIELNPTYINLSIKRLEMEARQQKLFV